jgi:hypothetical protein
MHITDEMVEYGCRGMYGKHWDGPPDKAPGEAMKNVWRKYSRSCLEAALHLLIEVAAASDPMDLVKDMQTWPEEIRKRHGISIADRPTEER